MFHHLQCYLGLPEMALRLTLIAIVLALILAPTIALERRAMRECDAMSPFESYADSVVGGQSFERDFRWGVCAAISIVSVILICLL